jgi:hypothetical protein
MNYFCNKNSVKNNKIKSQRLFCKKELQKRFYNYFPWGKIWFKRNYVKRQGQDSGATRPAQWKKRVAVLGRCGKRRRDEEKKVELCEYRKGFLIFRI